MVASVYLSRTRSRRLTAAIFVRVRDGGVDFLLIRVEQGLAEIGERGFRGGEPAGLTGCNGAGAWVSSGSWAISDDAIAKPVENCRSAEASMMVTIRQ